MGRIVLSEPDGPYSATIDAGVMDVTLVDIFKGVKFMADSGECLAVSMRDNGFEVHYYSDFGMDAPTGFDTGWHEFKGGDIHPMHMGAAKAEPMDGATPVDFEASSMRVTVIDPVRERVEAWLQAERMVDQILAQHPVEPYRTGSAFGITSTITAADQRIDHIRSLADWLLGKD